MKLKRGQKLCKNCNQINGARSYVCKHCNHEFNIGSKSTSKNKTVKTRKPKKFEEITDWTNLQNGDRIKVIGRSGNYYLGQDGERQFLTDAGIYTVKGTDALGLHVYSGGYGYIYMGPEIKSDIIPNMYRSPHKIVKVNPQVRQSLR